METLKYSNWIRPIERPSWDEVYLEQIETIKKRSIDFNKKQGVILVDENYHIVGTGYNSFPRNFPDSILPNARIKEIEPDCPKYHFIVHSEENAVCNLTTKNYKYLRAYCTGAPCVRCIRLLLQVGVKYIVLANHYGWQFSKDEKEYFDLLIYYGNVELTTLTEKYIFLWEQDKYIGQWVNK